jgi:hypothetical protein
MANPKLTKKRSTLYLQKKPATTTALQDFLPTQNTGTSSLTSVVGTDTSSGNMVGPSGGSSTSTTSGKTDSTVSDLIKAGLVTAGGAYLVDKALDYINKPTTPTTPTTPTAPKTPTTPPTSIVIPPKTPVTDPDSPDFMGPKIPVNNESSGYYKPPVTDPDDPAFMGPKVPVNNESSGYYKPPVIPVNNESSGYYKPPVTNPDDPDFMGPSLPVNNESSDYSAPPVNNESSGYYTPPNNESSGYYTPPVSPLTPTEPPVNNESSSYYTPPASPLSPTEPPVNNESSGYYTSPAPVTTPVAPPTTTPSSPLSPVNLTPTPTPTPEVPVNNESSGYYTPPASPLSPTPETPVNNESSSYAPTPTPEPTPAPVDDAMAAKAALYGMSLDEYKSYVDYYGEEYLDNYYAGVYDETPVNNESSSYTDPSTTPPKTVAEEYGMTEEEYAAYEEEYYRQYYEDYYKNYYDTTPVNNDSSDYTNYEPPVNNESSGYTQEQADYDAQVAEYNRYLEEQAAYDQYLKDQAAYDQYLKEQAEYDQYLADQAAYQQYLEDQAAYQEYLDQQAAYDQYLADLAEYTNSSGYYNNNYDVNNDTSSYTDSYVNNSSSGYYKKGGSIKMKNGGLPRFEEGGTTDYDRNYYNESSSYYVPDDAYNTTSSYYTTEPDVNNTSSGYYDSTPVNNDSSGYYTDSDVNNTSSGYYDNTPVNNDTSGYYNNEPVNNTSSNYNQQSPAYTAPNPANPIPINAPTSAPATPKSGSDLFSKLTSPDVLKTGLGLTALYQLIKAYEAKDDIQSNATMPTFQSPASRTTPFGMGGARSVATGNIPYQFPGAMDKQNLYSNLGVPGYEQDYEDPVEPMEGMAAGGMASNPDDMPYFTYGKPTDPMSIMGMTAPVNKMAKGGLPRADQKLPPMVEGRYDYRQSRAVVGEGDGQSDDIPAMLADGEYVFDADVVAALGNGSNKAGAEILDEFREKIRAHKRSAPIDEIPPKAKSPLAYMKEVSRG